MNLFLTIGIRWTENPSLRDARHILAFIEEYPNSSQGYVICRTPRAQKLTNTVIALPWRELHSVLELV